MVASEAKLDVKILKFTTQITRAHAHHQGRAGHKFWSVCLRDESSDKVQHGQK